MEYPRYKVRKDDNVMVMKGKAKGKTGRVVRVIPESAKLIVEKLNMAKRHYKPSKKYPHGGIVEKELPIAVANVMILCGKCKGPVRVGRKLLEDGKKVRYCKSCKEVLDK